MLAYSSTNLATPRAQPRVRSNCLPLSLRSTGDFTLPFAQPRFHARSHNPHRTTLVAQRTTLHNSADLALDTLDFAHSNTTARSTAPLAPIHSDFTPLHHFVRLADGSGKKSGEEGRRRRREEREFFWGRREEKTAEAIRLGFANFLLLFFLLSYIYGNLNLIRFVLFYLFRK